MVHKAAVNLNCEVLSQGETDNDFETASTKMKILSVSHSSKHRGHQSFKSRLSKIVAAHCCSALFRRRIDGAYVFVFLTDGFVGFIQFLS